MNTLKKCLLVALLSLTMLSMFSAPVSADGFGDCCLRYSRGRLPPSSIVGYVEQHSNEICDIDAVILYTVKGRAVCTNPESRWVKRVLHFLSKKLEEMSHQD
ncbi:C-C motif chemokine 20-like [Scyliorhinus canicula]|uniref:C-C motif chemokine 20-like n=1 Tax=Scyliorhinus canicula TaxID=7830 RepID=UPI0018F6F8B0|nr:C-C motif chemokine 20-like [Scyliorhinus canicula]